MNFGLKHIDDIFIFKVEEKKLDSTISGDFKGELTILCQSENIKKLVIDLGDVDYCDSSGLSALLLAYRQVRDNNGFFRIVAPSEKVSALIKISQLDRYLILKANLNEVLDELKILQNGDLKSKH